MPPYAPGSSFYSGCVEVHGLGPHPHSHPHPTTTLILSCTCTPTRAPSPEPRASSPGARPPPDELVVRRHMHVARTHFHRVGCQGRRAPRDRADTAPRAGPPSPAITCNLPPSPPISRRLPICMHLTVRRGTVCRPSGPVTSSTPALRPRYGCGLAHVNQVRGSAAEIRPRCGCCLATRELVLLAFSLLRRGSYSSSTHTY